MSVSARSRAAEDPGACVPACVPWRGCAHRNKRRIGTQAREAALFAVTRGPGILARAVPFPPAGGGPVHVLPGVSPGLSLVTAAVFVLCPEPAPGATGWGEVSKSRPGWTGGEVRSPPLPPSPWWLPPRSLSPGFPGCLGKGDLGTLLHPHGCSSPQSQEEQEEPENPQQSVEVGRNPRLPLSGGFSGWSGLWNLYLLGLGG